VDATIGNERTPSPRPLLHRQYFDCHYSLQNRVTSITPCITLNAKNNWKNSPSDTVHSDWMACFVMFVWCETVPRCLSIDGWTVWCFISLKAPEDRCYYRRDFFNLKFTKYRLAAGLHPDPLGGAKALPRSLAAIRGLTSKGREGRRGEGKGREGGLCPHMTFLHDAPALQPCWTSAAWERRDRLQEKLVSPVRRS